MAERPYTVRHAVGALPAAAVAVDALIARADAEVLQHGARSTVVALVLDGNEVVVKRIRERPLQALVLGSTATRVWRAAIRLRAARFPAPELLAVLERRVLGVVLSSCTIARRVRGAAVDEVWRAGDGAARRRLTCAFADYLRALHAAGLYPQDLRAANVLVAAEAPATFVLVDLDRVRVYRRLSWGRRKKNLVQVLRSVGRGAPATARVRFLRRYLGSPSRRELRRRATEILMLGDAKDAEYARRRRGATRAVTS
jgi:hypothetical protein